MEKPSEKYKKLIEIAKNLEIEEEVLSLEKVLRTNLEIIKLKDKIDRLEDSLADRKMAMFYFFAMNLNGDEINFILEKVNSKKKKIESQKEKEKEKDDK
tara:strand:+ start:260 stop:556 length:297 start_codon:yes stop_codon:yes gene_type:complete